jgi:hypothetical protein
LARGDGKKLVGLQEGKITNMELERSAKTEKPTDLNLLQLANVLAT